MSGVDVLAVMERAIISRPNVAIKRAIEGRPGLARDLIEARDTVAELIEALRQSDEWIKQAVINGSAQPSTATLFRNKAALANIGPQP